MTDLWGVPISGD